jgi:hypothetical protein
MASPSKEEAPPPQQQQQQQRNVLGYVTELNDNDVL